MLRLISSLLLIATAVLMHTSAFSRVLLVPEEYDTIQGAVNAAENGDTVLVHSGRYAENIVIADKSLSLLSEAGLNETILVDTEEASPYLKFRFGYCKGIYIPARQRSELE